MVEIKLSNGKIVTFDQSKLINNLQVMQDLVKFDRDIVMLICGLPGNGKTNFSTQVLTFLDPMFELSRIAWRGREYVQKCSTLSKGSAVMLDESRNVAAGDKHAEYLSKRFLDYFSLNRQRNLFHALLMPDFFDFRKNIAVHRSHCLIVIYQEQNREYVPGESDPMQRGYYAFFDFERKANLYKKYKKDGIMPRINDLKGDCRPNFIGQFSSRWVIDKVAYDKLKSDDLLAFEKEFLTPSDQKKKAPRIERRSFTHKGNVVKNLLVMYPHMKQKDIAKILNSEEANVSHWIKKIKEGGSFNEGEDVTT